MNSHSHWTVHTNQGGELGRCVVLKELLANKYLGFSLKPKGADALAQNGKYENPNHVHRQMMRYILHSEDIGLVYWSFALIYTV